MSGMRVEHGRDAEGAGMMAMQSEEVEQYTPKGSKQLKRVMQAYFLTFLTLGA
jgi:hypothetical protein